MMKTELEALYETVSLLRSDVRVLAAVTERSHDEILRLRAERDKYKRRKDEAYDERNRVVALLAKMAIGLGWKAGVGVHEDKPGEVWDPAWRTLLVIETPQGQASWHYHDDHVHLLRDLPRIEAVWDGHDTPTKYARIDKISADDLGLISFNKETFE